MPRSFDDLNERELSDLDAMLAARESPWWDSFYQDRAKPRPFFTASPCESLAESVNGGLIRPGRALDLGCGSGRNAISWLAMDSRLRLSTTRMQPLSGPESRAVEAGVDVSLTCCNVFALEQKASSYDLVYDSGCFHHIAPHRRDRYVDLVVDALKPGGWFGLTCFRPEGGSGYTDDEVYERRSLGGGLGYTEELLRETWSRGLEIQVLRQMNKTSAESGLFGEEFLWVLLARRAVGTPTTRTCARAANVGGAERKAASQFHGVRKHGRYWRYARQGAIGRQRNAEFPYARG